jgi:hypothetical protein
MPYRRGSILIMLALAGCFDEPEPVTSSSGSSSVGEEENTDTTDTGDGLMLGGTWDGLWMHMGDSGGVHLQLFHSGGSEVTGTMSFDITELFQCITDANVTATLEGDQLTGTTMSNDDVMAFTVTVTDTQMTGDWEITAGDCGVGLAGTMGMMKAP